MALRGETALNATGEAPDANNQHCIMFLHRKTNGPALFMKFGVDHQGFVVPFLRRAKNQSLEVNPGLKPSSLRPKVAFRLRG